MMKDHLPRNTKSHNVLKSIILVKTCLIRERCNISSYSEIREKSTEIQSAKVFFKNPTRLLFMVTEVENNHVKDKTNCNKINTVIKDDQQKGLSDSKGSFSWIAKITTCIHRKLSSYLKSAFIFNIKYVENESPLYKPTFKHKRSLALMVT